MRHLVWFILVLGFISTVAAQDAACPTLVQNALEYTDSVCSATARNQACYGNLQVSAMPVEDVASFKFDAPGDIESITAIQSLQLSALSTPETWGVMLMQVQANLPDTVPGQNVTMLLFGDVNIENQGGTTKSVILEATASGNARVRSGAGTSNSQIASLKGGDAVQVDGRNEAGDWLRVVLADGNTGWVSASLMQITGDTATLNVVEGTEIAGTAYGPMQAFYFTSGIGEADCNEAPPDGILIQTPQGAGKIDLLINEAQISVGSTIFLTAQKSGDMRVNVLEGQVNLTSQDTTITVPAGAVGIVPLDANGVVNGTPTLEGYGDETVVLAIPASLLPQEFEIATGLTETELNFIPQSGDWVFTIVEHIFPRECFVGESAILGNTRTLRLEFAANQMSMAGAIFKKTGMNTYTVSSKNRIMTYVFNSPTSGTLTDTWTIRCGDTSISSVTYSGNE